MQTIRTVYQAISGNAPPCEPQDLISQIKALTEQHQALAKALKTSNQVLQQLASHSSIQANTARAEIIEPVTTQHAHDTATTAAEAQIATNEATTYKERYERLRAENEAREQRELYDDKNRMPSVDEAVAYLQMRAIGKRIDETYQAYCGAIIREYLTKRQRVSTILECAIVNGAMAVHSASIKNVTTWDLHAAMQYNDNIDMVQRKTVRVANWIITIPFTQIALSTLNWIRPTTPSGSIAYTSRQLTFQSILFWILRMIMSYLAGKYVIIPLFLYLMSFITTLSLLTQPPPPTPTDTNPNIWMSMIPTISVTLGSYINSSVDYGLGVMKSISTVWTVPANEDFITELSKKCEMDEKSRVALLLSQSSKKWEQASTKLQDSYKQGIQHSTSLMESMSNHSSEALNMTSILVKELTTKLEQKSTSLLKGTNTILKETIVPLMHTSLETCSSYATIFTNAATSKTQTYATCVKKRYETMLSPEPAKATESVEQECQETLIPALETVSSTIISYATPLAKSAYEATPSSTAMTSYFSRTVHYLSTPIRDYYEHIIWKRRWELAMKISITLSFAAAALFIILMVIRRWRLTQREIRRRMEPPIYRLRRPNIPRIAQ